MSNPNGAEADQIIAVRPADISEASLPVILEKNGPNGPDGHIFRGWGKLCWIYQGLGFMILRKLPPGETEIISILVSMGGDPRGSRGTNKIAATACRL